MKVGVLILALVASTYAAAAESFEIISSEVRGICDTAARESLYKKQIRAADAYCGQGSYAALTSVPVINATGNENCNRAWAEYSSASGKAQFECSSVKFCEPNCLAYGLDFSFCHSTCGGW